MLTIDTNSLGCIFIPAYVQDLAAVEEIDRLITNDAVTTRMQGHRMQALVRAFVNCKEVLMNDVILIKDMGGLLLIGNNLTGPEF